VAARTAWSVSACMDILRATEVAIQDQAVEPVRYCGGWGTLPEPPVQRRSGFRGEHDHSVGSQVPSEGVHPIMRPMRADMTSRDRTIP